MALLKSFVAFSVSIWSLKLVEKAKRTIRWWFNYFSALFQLQNYFLRHLQRQKYYITIIFIYLSLLVFVHRKVFLNKILSCLSLGISSTNKYGNVTKEHVFNIAVRWKKFKVWPFHWEMPWLSWTATVTPPPPTVVVYGVEVSFKYIGEVVVVVSFLWSH